MWEMMTSRVRDLWNSTRIGFSLSSDCTPLSETDRLTSRQLFWIANSKKRKVAIHWIHESAARFAAGRPAKKTDGLVTAGTNGTRSIAGASALPASTNGLRHNASRVPTGRHTRIGITIHEFRN